MHLDGLVAITETLFAAPALHIEREPSRFPSTDLRLRHAGKEIAYVAEHIGVGGGVRTRCTPNRRLVHIDYLVYMLHAFDIRIRERFLETAIELLGEQRIERLVDQARLAATTHARDAYHPA